MAQILDPCSFIRQSGEMRLPILMYHQVFPETHFARKSHLSVSREVFIQQLDQLKGSGWNFVTQDQARRYIQEQKSGSLALTFDDLSSPFFDYVLPVLEEYQIPATVFVITNLIKGKSCFNLPSAGFRKISISQLRLLISLGIEVGSHCVSHQDLTTLPAKEIRQELKQSKMEIEDMVGQEVRSLAYPLGGFNSEIIDVAQEAGYLSAVSTVRGSIQRRHHPFSLKRVTMGEERIGRKLNWSTSPTYGFKRHLLDTLRGAP